jgi:hypothetical protein
MPDDVGAIVVILPTATVAAAVGTMVEKRNAWRGVAAAQWFDPRQRQPTVLVSIV